MVIYESTSGFPEQTGSIEFDAACILLTARSLARRTEPHIEWDHRSFDWPGLLTLLPPLSSAEQMLVRFAWDFGEGQWDKDWLESLGEPFTYLGQPPSLSRALDSFDADNQHRLLVAINRYLSARR